MPGRTSKPLMSFDRKWTVDHGKELDRLLRKTSDAISSVQQAPDEPLPIVLGDSGADAGDGPTPALEDHVHTLPVEAPVAVSTANAEGTSEATVRADHVHELVGHVTTKGDLWTHDGATAVRIPVPTDPGYVLVSDPTEDVGWSWQLVQFPAWRKVQVTHLDLQAAAMANDIELLELPVGGVVHAVKIKHSTPFAGAGITDYKLSVGIVGNLTKYAAAFDVDTPSTGTNFQLSTVVGSESHTAPISLRLAATSTGANLSLSTAGFVEVWVLVSQATS